MCKNYIIFCNIKLFKPKISVIISLIHTTRTIITSNNPKFKIIVPSIFSVRYLSTYIISMTTITQVFINLLSNSRDAMEIGGRVSATSHQKEHTIVVEVEDNGSGIPEEVLKRIYEPFVTTKDPGKGTGLGMSLVYSIVEEHYGHINILSPLDSEKGGTRVTITLPRYHGIATSSVSEVNQEEQHEPYPDR